MKIQFTAENVKLRVVSDQNVDILIYATEKYSLEANLTELLRGFAALQANAQNIVAKMAAEEDETFQAMMAQFETKPKDEA